MYGQLYHALSQAKDTFLLRSNLIAYTIIYSSVILTKVWEIVYSIQQYINSSLQRTNEDFWFIS